MRADTKEYLETIQGIVGKTTRGIVVSVQDPLCAGRVKVYIPIIHGGLALENGETVEDIPSSGIKNTILLSDALKASGDSTNSAINLFPWAPVLGHNWGSTGDVITGASQSLFGVFNIPKVGTEVFIIFENNDPNLPVVIGSAFHNNELLGTVPPRAIELTPGVDSFTSYTSADQEMGNYENRVSENYIIASQKGSKLLISDISQEQQIRLEGFVSLLDTALSGTGPGTIYDKFSQAYPNFPSTASSPYTKRNPPTVASPILKFSDFSSNPVLNPNLSKTQQAEVISAREAAMAQQANQTIADGSNDVGANSRNIKIEKRYPITSVPVIPKPGGLFGAARSGGRLHMGIDLSTPVGTPLLAPVLCIPMFYRATSSAGTILIVKGADGFMHTFMHLQSVNASIQRNIANGQYLPITSGSQLGTTGGKRGLNGDEVSTGNGHLHWETYSYEGLSITSSSDAWELRQARTSRNTSNFNGTTIAAYSCIDPQNWLKSAGVGTSWDISGGQLAAFAQTTISPTNADFQKPIGLEMCLVPGLESLSIRHPSGSSITIDPDGNIKFYSVGDIQFKSNRSIIFNAFGGILQRAFAMYTKVTSVIKQYAPHTVTSPSNFPPIFASMDDFELADMKDAIAASSSNAYYALLENGVGKPLSQIATDGYSIYIDPSQMPEKNINLDQTYVDLIIKAHDTYFVKNTDTNIQIMSRVFTPSVLKSVAIIESNSDPNATNGTSVGLFQLQPMVFAQFNGREPSTSEIADYAKPEKNIDLAVKYFAYLAKQVIADTSTMYNAAGNTFNLSALSSDQQFELVKIILFYYNSGETYSRPFYKQSVQVSVIPNYCEFEKIYAASSEYKNAVTRATMRLRYVPYILYIKKKLGS